MGENKSSLPNAFLLTRNGLKFATQRTRRAWRGHNSKAHSDVVRQHTCVPERLIVLSQDAEPGKRVQFRHLDLVHLRTRPVHKDGDQQSCENVGGVRVTSKVLAATF